MEKYKKEITVTEEFYEISKEELEQIKKLERARGRAELADYILFCFSNYTLVMNYGGIFKFLKELLAFLFRDKNGISNKRNIDFFDYAEERERLQEEIKD